MNSIFASESELSVNKKYDNANRVLAPSLFITVIGCVLSSASMSIFSVVVLFSAILLALNFASISSDIKRIEQSMGFWQRQLYPFYRGWLFFLVFFTSSFIASGLLTIDTLNSLPSFETFIKK